MKIGVLRDKKEVTILITSYLSIVVNVELIAQIVIITLLKAIINLTWIKNQNTKSRGCSLVLIS